MDGNGQIPLLLFVTGWQMPRMTMASTKELRQIPKVLTAGAHQLTALLAAGLQFFLKGDLSGTSIAVTASTSLCISLGSSPESPQTSVTTYPPSETIKFQILSCI